MSRVSLLYVQRGVKKRVLPVILDCNGHRLTVNFSQHHSESFDISENIQQELATPRQDIVKIR